MTTKPPRNISDKFIIFASIADESPTRFEIPVDGVVHAVLAYLIISGYTSWQFNFSKSNPQVHGSSIQHWNTVSESVKVLGETMGFDVLKEQLLCGSTPALRLASLLVEPIPAC